MCSQLLGAKATRPSCSNCSFVAHSCPWSVRSPQGEFLRERGKLKIVALGEQGPFALPRPFSCSLTLVSDWAK